MNLLDKTIAWLSPKAGLQRARYRSAVDVALDYEGARTGRRTDGWATSGASANTVIRGGISTLRNRARDLVINNPRAARIVEVHATNLIGAGLIPRARTGNDKLDAIIDALFKLWAVECDADEQLDFYGLQALVGRTIVQSGECLTRFRPRRPSDGLNVPLQLQILEPDYIDSNRNQGFTNDGSLTIQGVVMDQLGRRTGYWMFNQHPGEVVNNGNFVSKIIPATEILHTYKKDRPGQVRGVTWFAPIILKLRDIDDYDDADMVRKKIEACLAAFVTQPDGADGQTIAGAESSTDPNTGERIEQFAPGMIEYLRPGEQVVTAAPAQNSDYAPYISVQDHVIATGANVTYEQATGNLSQVNYSSYRAGHLQFNKTVTQARRHMIIPMWCQPIWRRFIDAAFLAGEIPEANYGVEWNVPRFESVDPHKDAFAAMVKMRSGTQTWPQAVAEQGFNPDDQLREIVEYNALFDKFGVKLDIDPRFASKAGVVQKTEDSASG